MLNYLIKLAENGTLPDFLIKKGIKNLCNDRLKWAKSLGPDKLHEHNQEWIEELKQSPIALVPEKANEQHYELPPSFFDIVLGSNLKYSSGYWPTNQTTFDQSEVEMLELSCKKEQNLKINKTFLNLDVDGVINLFYGTKISKFKNYSCEQFQRSKKTYRDAL